MLGTLEIDESDKEACILFGHYAEPQAEQGEGGHMIIKTKCARCGISL